jgi:hypothetical protein
MASNTNQVVAINTDDKKGGNHNEDNCPEDPKDWGLVCYVVK